MKYSKRLSRYLLPTVKEDPKEAEIPSHRLMIRAGMIRKLASGIYEFLPLGWRVVKKVENIIREEMDGIGGQEMIMSAVQPKSLWDETGSGRWYLYGPELIRFTDRNDREFCLGPTHEEVITHIVASNVKSYKELPLLLYQFQMKYRDEIRPRFGIMRAREFYMKDAYSFDRTVEDCRKSYEDNFKAYERIFRRCGLDFVSVEADTGNIGGQSSHEFMVIADTGEEEIAVCRCGYGANTEMAEFRTDDRADGDRQEAVRELEEVHTPGVTTVEEVAGFLKETPKKFIKTLLFRTDDGRHIAAFIRGDHELSEHALKKAASANAIEFIDDDTIKKKLKSSPGFSGPVGLSSSGAAIELYMDSAAAGIVNGISGADRKDYHLRNINVRRDMKADFREGNFRKARQGDLCPKCGGALVFKRGIEVGHTFLLGTKYSESMKAVFVNDQGSEENMIMGCYGIGVTRVVAAAIEQSHDGNGIIWPAPISPFDVLLVQIARDADEFCAELFGKLSEEYEVLWDDRALTPGVKFKDAQLIGIPVQIVIGKKYKETGEVEIQYRKTGEKEFVRPEHISEKLKKRSG
ncbi:MAG: proline--tRNA ligase [Elusimicrobia bacterium]|nr:proline--tRNA ligase [Elusimicrobiota bacterium]